MDGNASAWFDQNNEHRLVVGNLLSWIDLEWFGGKGVVLAVANIAILLG
jgi:hypothetical protein